MIELCAFADLPDGAARGFDPAGTGRDTMFVVRQGSEVVAYVNECPHWDHARMAWRKDQYLNGEGSHIMCAAHGALFEISTGICVLGPCVGKRLKLIELRIDAGRIALDPAELSGQGDR